MHPGYNRHREILGQQPVRKYQNTIENP